MRLIALFVLLGTAGVFAAADVTPQQAIAAAVRERVGASATVTVDDVETAVSGERGLVAQPEAAARIGQPARFVLSVNGVRRGLAVATVTVEVAYPRATRSIARDEVIDTDAVHVSEGLMTGLQIRALLTADRARGLQARRDIAAGEALTESVLRVPPVIKSGDAVEATVRIGAVTVTGTGTASGRGQVGDVIRVMQPHSSRLLNARIVGPGAVEIVK